MQQSVFYNKHCQLKIYCFLCFFFTVAIFFFFLLLINKFSEEVVVEDLPLQSDDEIQFFISKQKISVSLTFTGLSLRLNGEPYCGTKQ